MVEAYSHECSSCGFWPGGGAGRGARVLRLCVSRAGRISPSSRCARRRALLTREMREFVLPYAARPRTPPSPTTLLLEFLQSTYEAAADLGRWDRALLERSAGP